MIDKNEKLIKLVELSQSWQGEGPDMGRSMVITRFKYCNKHCSFCDTIIKMKTFSEGSYSINDINQSLQKTKALMITGGEPTFISKDKKIDNLSQTVLMLSYCDYQTVNIETNGCQLEQLIFEFQRCGNTRKNEKWLGKIIYSPKIFSTEDYNIELEKTIKLINKPFLYMKIVADGSKLTEKFIKEISSLSNEKGKIYLMPLGTTYEEITKNWPYCIDLADECNLNLSSRLHIMNQFI